MSRYTVVTVPSSLNQSAFSTLYALVAIEDEGTPSEVSTATALYASLGSAKFSAEARNAL